MGDGKYARVYHSIVDDPKFASIYDDDRCLATWLRLLLIAESSWPLSASIPRSAHPKALRLLVGVGLIDIEGSRFRVHGLDAERSARSNAARIAARNRWGNATGSAETMLVRERVLERDNGSTTTPKSVRPPNGAVKP